MNLRENVTAVNLSYRIRSCVLGYYHQRDKRFGSTAGVQCASMSITTFILVSLIGMLVCVVDILLARSVVAWKIFDLDRMLNIVDRVYKEQGGVHHCMPMICQKGGC